MFQRVHLITLGVDDLNAAAAFYAALGWQKVEDGAPGIVAFDLYGASLGLYPRADLARDMGRELPRGSGSMTLSHNVREKDDIDAVIEAARAAGATILKEPHDVFWGGRTSYFTDLDDHVWEVAWNPFSPLGEHDEFQWGGA